MSASALAIYDAREGVLRLDRKLDLLNQSQVKVIVEPVTEQPTLARQVGGTIVIDEEVARHIVEHEDLIGVE